MKRAVALMLMVIYGLALATPLLAYASGDPESKLPACCRRNGSHHCAISDAYQRQMASDGPAFAAPPQHCPFYPQHAQQSRIQAVLAALSAQSLICASVESHPACHAQTEALSRIAFDRSRLKRGPPESYFL